MIEPVVKRNPAMDIVRCLALFGVNSVHFFLQTDFYNTLLVGSRLYLFTLIRAASMTCVPLFLMLSGYLMKNKTATRAYYGKLTKTLCLYFLASLCCYLYSSRLSGSVFNFLLGLLGFGASPYAWYVNMYLGLFLLIPYLNVLYNALSGKKSRQGLIVTLLLLTSVAGLFNCCTYSPETGWQLSGEINLYQPLVPDWWMDLYPLTYYFLGAYLRDHPLNLRRRKIALLLVLVMIGNGTLNFFLSYGQEFMHGAWQDWGSILNVAQSVLLFQLLAQTDFRFLSGKPAKLLSKISELSLSAFLVSWIFDDWIYSRLIRFQPLCAYQLIWYPVTTVLVFVGSLCLAGILDRIYWLLCRVFRLLRPVRAAN